MSEGNPISRPGGARALLPALSALLLAAACTQPAHDDDHHHEEASASWSVTAWGELYEVFLEVDPLIAGEAATAHAHVTVLSDFVPMTEGSVEILLSSPAGEKVVSAEQPVRPGIYEVELVPETAGEVDLTFRVASAAGSEEIRGGRVRVGTPEAPGGIVVAPAPKGSVDGGEPLSFLKEEQWRTPFATARVRRGALARSVSGFARIRTPAGGEATVSSPVDGVLRPEPWPYPGRRVERGAPLFRLVPRVAADSSLPALGAELAALDTDLSAARARLSRLEELLELGATSVREVEEARARLETLAARRSAAARDLEAARSAREGGSSAALTLRAPFGGEVASLAASPGGTVAAGEALARLVRTDLLWIEVALSPQAVRTLAGDAVAGVVLTDGESDPVRLEDGLRLISVAPELDPRTGTVTVLLEAPATPGLILGTAMEARVLLGRERDGIVVPSSAVVDDGGVPVVYLQVSGESFVRREVRVLERQGDRLLTEGLAPGQRLVTRGGDAIRRSSLLAGGGDEHGHLH